MASFQFPIATGKKKPVKVFECPTETWKERAPRSAKKSDKDAEPELSLKQQIRQEFDETFESVKDFANASLKGKEKKAFEAKKIEALGGKAAKTRTMPYNILMGLKKKGAIREKKQQEMNKDADVVSGKRKASSKSNSSKKKKKIDYGLQVTKGKFKNGILTIELMNHAFGLVASATTALAKKLADSFSRERDVRQRVPARREELENYENESQHDPLALLEPIVERDEQRQHDQEQVQYGDRPAVAAKHVLQLPHRSDEEHRGAE